MKELRYTLRPDGSSDAALIPILTWLLRRNGISCPIQSQLVDLQRLPQRSRSLKEQIPLVLDVYPCDLLFIHRDAEREPREKRVIEIQEAISAITEKPPIVCIIPIRMQEAWLLFDELAIRRAAGNPNGKNSLQLPRLKQLEELPDPKVILHDLLKEASQLTGRRRKQLNVHACARRVTVCIEDFSPLYTLSAFQVLESDLQGIILSQGWATPLLEE